MPDRFPSSEIPCGWYVLRPSTKLRARQQVGVRYFGRDMVLYRTEAGRAHLVDAICPHMGAHLGLGQVRGENLVCGLHGFEFDGGGRCVKLAYGTRPPSNARLGSYPVHETDGFVWGWYSADGAPPSWKLEPLNWEDWTPLRHHRLLLEAHPQEITENSVDMGHFKSVHYYRASIEQDTAAEAESLSAAYRVVRPWFGKRLEGLTFEVLFRVLARGFGYSLIHADVQRPPIQIRYFVNATPIDGARTHLNLAASVRKLPVPGLSSIIREAVFYGLRHDVSQDVPFWETKHHREKPVLAEGDGAIGTYRSWCTQFYPVKRGST